MKNNGSWGTLITIVIGAIIAIFLFWLFEKNNILQWTAVIITIFFTIPAAYASYILTPWLPTPCKELERIKNIAALQEGQIFYDLGCGDGRIVIYMSKNTKAKCVGLEVSPFHFLLATINKLFSRQKNLQIRLANIFKENLSQVDVAYIWACPSQKLTEKLEKELKAGSKIISYESPLYEKEANAIDQPNPKDTKIYIYHF